MASNQESAETHAPQGSSKKRLNRAIAVATAGWFASQVATSSPVAAAPSKPADDIDASNRSVLNTPKASANGGVSVTYANETHGPLGYQDGDEICGELQLWQPTPTGIIGDFGDRLADVEVLPSVTIPGSGVRTDQITDDDYKGLVDVSASLDGLSWNVTFAVGYALTADPNARAMCLPTLTGDKIDNGTLTVQDFWLGVVDLLAKASRKQSDPFAFLSDPYAIARAFKQGPQFAELIKEGDTVVSGQSFEKNSDVVHVPGPGQPDPSGDPVVAVPPYTPTFHGSTSIGLER